MNGLGLSERVKRTRHGLATIAAWQFAAFLLLLLLVWASELLDLPAVMYGAAPTPPDYWRAALLTIFVVFAAVLTVGQTYLAQRRILSGFITLCARCHKVKVDHDMWQQIEKYVSHYCPVTFSHGLCPTCFADEVRALEAQRPAPPTNGRPAGAVASRS